MNKKIAALGVTAGLAVGGVSGVVLAAPTLSGAQTTDSTVAEEGADDATRPEPGTRIAEALAPLVEDGTLTQEQADAVATTLAESLPEGRGKGGRGGRGGQGLDAAASALGTTADELRDQLRDGQTIAEVAAAAGVDVQTVIDAMVAEARTHLDEKVASGDVTQEEADARLSELTERITERVSSGVPEGGRHGSDSGSGEVPEDAPADDATS